MEAIQESVRQTTDDKGLTSFEPEILAYCCEHWAYSAADLAGSMRLSYPTNVKIVKVPCTGRVDILLILKAFESGADGVYLAGCLEGECHFLRGNLRAKKRVQYVKTLLDEVGLGSGRVEMVNMSSAQGQRFAEVAREMTEKIRGLGPSPVRIRNSECGVRTKNSEIRNPKSAI